MTFPVRQWYLWGFTVQLLYVKVMFIQVQVSFRTINIDWSVNNGHIMPIYQNWGLVKTLDYIFTSAQPDAGNTFSEFWQW